MSNPTPAPTFSLCVYCGSRPGLDPAFHQAAVAVGRWIAAHGGQLVYGGGRAGLMGAVADAALQAGARVVGVIPHALVAREHAHRGCTELIEVATMHERKRIMAERADAFLALPGGIGTFEELFEVWTLHQLGYLHKPLGLLNTQGYYDGLLRFLDHAQAQGLMDASQRARLHTGDSPAPLLARLVQAAGVQQPSRLDIF